VVGLLLLVSTGCGRVSFESTPVDATADVGPDASDADGTDTGAVVDSGPGTDTGSGTDSGGAMDSGPPTSSACTPASASDLVHFAFDGDDGASMLTDATGSANAIVRGGTASLVAGPTGCGQALSFATGVEAVIPDSPRWDLDEGSIDLWVWRPTGRPAPWAGIISRDAGGSAFPGHFSIYVANDGRIVARLQNGGDFTLCSVAPLPEESWHHIGVNFGPGGFELWLDGVQEEGTGVLPMFPSDCSTGTSSITAGIAGNDNPWLIGANTATGGEGVADSSEPFTDGAIDHLRISDSRRDFRGFVRTTP